MNRRPSLPISLAAGAIAGAGLTVVLGVLRLIVGTSWPPELIGDRIAPLITISFFNDLLVMAGGYNELKQLGVLSAIAGQVVAGAVLGLVYLRLGGSPERRRTLLAAILAGVWVLILVAFWPILDTNYRGLPRTPAIAANALAHLVAIVSFAAILLTLESRLTRDREPVALLGRHVSRRAVLVAGGAGVGFLALFAVFNRLSAGATVYYDGLRYKGRDVQAITPNDRFYTVTKNVSDPTIDASLWRFEVGGLVDRPRTYTFDELRLLSSTVQETTLMCIRNAVGDGLMSNAQWKGIPLRSILEAAGPRPGVVKAVLRGTDSYSDTIAIAKAMDPATLLAFEMNGEPLPLRHGYPVRVIVPGLFGEKNVKWVTRVDLVDHDAKGFYESQGWGPSFVIPTHSRFDVPDDGARVAAAPMTLRGIAFAGARGIRAVEVSLDAGRSWRAARIDHPGTTLTWALWSYDWRPEPGAVEALVRATDGGGALQTATERGTIPEGSTGYHRIRFMVA
ncbi:MAG: hypothetical protein NVS1B1_01520 [Candidatus Limnocylindrales bacterium]